MRTPEEIDDWLKVIQVGNTKVCRFKFTNAELLLQEGFAFGSGLPLPRESNLALYARMKRGERVFIEIPLGRAK